MQVVLITCNLQTLSVMVIVLAIINIVSVAL